MTTRKRVADMTFDERKAARERAGIRRETLAGPCKIVAETIRKWEQGVPARNLLAFDCYLENLERLLDEKAGAQ